MIDHPVLLIVALVVAAPVLWLFWRQFFGDREDLADDLERLHQVRRSPLRVALRGEYQDHAWSSLRLLIFLLIGFGFAAGLYRALSLLFF